MGHTERYGVRLRFECNRVTHLLHRDAGTACLRGARYAPTDPMESAKRALDGSQPVDGARELEPRTLVRNRHLGAPFHTRNRAHENNNVAQAARSRLAPVRWCRAALGGQAGCMAPPVAVLLPWHHPEGGLNMVLGTGWRALSLTRVKNFTTKLPRTNTLTILGTYTRHTKHYSLAGEDWRALHGKRISKRRMSVRRDMWHDNIGAFVHRKTRRPSPTTTAVAPTTQDAKSNCRIRGTPLRPGSSSSSAWRRWRHRLDCLCLSAMSAR